jgi:hypothetical protein
VRKSISTAKDPTMSNQDTNHYSPLPPIGEVPVIPKPDKPQGQVCMLEIWATPEGVRCLTSIPDHLHQSLEGALILLARGAVQGMLKATGAEGVHSIGKTPVPEEPTP